MTFLCYYKASWVTILANQLIKMSKHVYFDRLRSHEPYCTNVTLQLQINIIALMISFIL